MRVRFSSVGLSSDEFTAKWDLGLKPGWSRWITEDMAWQGLAPSSVLDPSVCFLAPHHQLFLLCSTASAMPHCHGTSYEPKLYSKSQ